MACVVKTKDQWLCAPGFVESVPPGQSRSNFSSWGVSRIQGWGKGDPWEDKKDANREDTRPKWLAKNDKNTLAKANSEDASSSNNDQTF